MEKPQCLFCYGELNEAETDFHKQCSKKIFGKAVIPILPYTEEDINHLAEMVIRNQVSVPGVQPKLSLQLDKPSKNDKNQRFTIVGLWGEYILKPPTKLYSHLPELEDLTMHLARLSGINTVPHSLIRFKNGKLAYITRRIDRVKGNKIHMEDMCQLTERLTEYKYKGSYEQIGKAIAKYSATPMLDIINFFEQVIFSFLTGNADMHLKNFSLINQPQTGYVLSPAYDLIASALVVENDDEDLALHINGKKKKIKRTDFLQSFRLFNIDTKSIENIFSKFEKSIPNWFKFIEISFIPNDMKKQYIELIKQKADRIELQIR